MIRAKLLYAALIVVMVLFFVLYRGNLSFELLIFTLLFPLPLLLSVVWMKHSLRAELFHSREPVLKGEFFQWVLQITNQTIFSSSNAQVFLEYSNSLTGEKRTVTLTIPVMPRNVQRLRLSFHAVTCGVMTMTVKQIVIFDALRLFKCRLRLNAEDSVMIMPAPTALLPEKWPPTPQPDADTTEYSKEKAGDDPSEIFDLHNYREGDHVSRIHWKLSSKLDTLMVKEYSLPLSAGCLMIPDYRHISKAPVSALRVDAMLSAVSAAMMQLFEQETSFSITGYSPKSGLRSSELFSSLSDAAQWMKHTVRQHPVLPEERAGLLNSIQDYLRSAHPYERILLFTPQLDSALCEMLLTLPEPERITVFAVVSQNEQSVGESIGRTIRCVPILLQEPVHPRREALQKLENPDFETEVLVQGGVRA